MIAAHPYPISYPGYGSKLCPSCLDSWRGHVVLTPYWTRAVHEDFASLLYVCLRCGHNETAVATVPLNEDTKWKMTAPAVKPRSK